MLNRKCKNCGDLSSFHPMEYQNDLEICDKCGGWEFTGKVTIAPKDIYDFSYYNGSEYLSYKESIHIFKMNFKRKLNLVKKNLYLPLSEWRLLEIGCATGGFLEVCRDEGIKNLLGCEISDFSRTEAIKLGFDVFDPSLIESTQEKIKKFSPNVIVAWDVWEHLSDPADYFSQIIKTCKNQPVLAISTVDASALIPRTRKTSWRQYHPPSHLNFPTRTSLKNFYELNSLEIGHHGSFGYYRPAMDYISAIIGKKMAMHPTFNWAAHVPLYLNLFDIQIIISKLKEKA